MSLRDFFAHMDSLSLLIYIYLHCTYPNKDILSILLFLIKQLFSALCSDFFLCLYGQFVLVSLFILLVNISDVDLQNLVNANPDPGQ